MFVREVRRKRSELERILGSEGGLRERYGELVREAWIRDLEPRGARGPAYAVDSSSDDIEVQGGGVVLVTRSLALSAGGEEIRELRLDAFYPRNVRDYDDFKRLVREHVEHVVALRAVEEGARLVLIDGSLYGRMIHVLRELEVEGREDFMFEYVELYSELFSKARSRGALVVGVSKDSRSTVLKEELLYLRLKSVLKGLGEPLAGAVLGYWRLLKRRPREALENVRKLVREGLSPEVYELFEEATSSVPDSKVILACDPGRGFSRPLRLSLEKVSTGVTDILLTDGARGAALLRDVFEKTAERLGEEFDERASQVLECMKKYPPVVTSYAVFSRGDDPLRVDLAGGGGYETAGDSRFLAETPGELLEVLGFLALLYAGRRRYNALLLEADRRVKATAETMELYHRLAMQELGLAIIHSRGDRRVFFP